MLALENIYLQFQSCHTGGEERQLFFSKRNSQLKRNCQNVTLSKKVLLLESTEYGIKALDSIPLGFIHPEPGTVLDNGPSMSKIDQTSSQ